MLKQLKGIVVSDKMPKTVVVRVDRFVKHKLYGKYIKKSKKYKAHDENGEYKNSEKVIIVECRPISKDKKWKIVGRV